MNKKYWAIGLCIISLFVWLFPNWNGLLFEPSMDITTGDGRIMASILFVGGLILWYLPKETK